MKEVFAIVSAETTTGELVDEGTGGLVLPSHQGEFCEPKHVESLGAFGIDAVVGTESLINCCPLQVTLVKFIR